MNLLRLDFDDPNTQTLLAVLVALTLIIAVMEHFNPKKGARKQRRRGLQDRQGEIID